MIDAGISVFVRPRQHLEPIGIPVVILIRIPIAIALECGIPIGIPIGIPSGTPLGIAYEPSFMGLSRPIGLRPWAKLAV